MDTLWGSDRAFGEQRDVAFDNGYVQRATSPYSPLLTRFAFSYRGLFDDSIPLPSLNVPAYVFQRLYISFVADGVPTSSDLEDSIQTPEQIDAYYYSINPLLRPQEPNDYFLVNGDNLANNVLGTLDEPGATSSSLTSSALFSDAKASDIPTPTHHPTPESDAGSSDSGDEYSYGGILDPFVENVPPLTYSPPGSSFHTTPSLREAVSPFEDYLPSPPYEPEGSVYDEGDNFADVDADADEYQEYQGGRRANLKKGGQQPKAKPYDSQPKKPKQKKTPTKSAPARAGPDGLYLGVANTVAEYMEALHPPASNGRAKRRFRVTDVKQCLLCGKTFATPRRHLETAPDHGGIWMEKLLNDPLSLSGKLLAVVVHFMFASCDRLASDPATNFVMPEWTPALTAAQELFMTSFEDLSAPHISLFRLEGEYVSLLELSKHWARYYVSSRTCWCGKVFSRADCVHRCTHSLDSK